ncbi:ubiquitin-like domain-containing protein [Zhaonella formicivorans]|uniref:ubiquitin-like domain-containing protein n=1 Tax=Zhaonella formicivorans TaxID=2528593 RepID=UPI0010D914DF|nr:ubiquitin-like domain-containing protein [Zhaonella formicivorans]
MNAWISGWRKQLVQAQRKRQYIIISIITGIVIFSLGLTTYAWALKDLNLMVDGKSIQVKTFKSEVGEVLLEQGITLAPEDKVSYELTTPLQDGMTIQVIRAFPVQVQVDGKVLQVTTTPTTVEQILKQAKIVLGPHDKVSPSGATFLKSSGKITVQRIGFKEVVQENVIPFQVEREPNASLEKGQTKVIQEGKEGLERKIIKITYQDGKEISRQVVKSEIVQKPVNRRIAYGTLSMVSRGGHNLRFSQSLVVTATAYTHTGNRTYSGTIPKVGTVAVDPDVIPLGSKLYIEGYGFGRALDVGSAIQGERIDVFLESEDRAAKWGRKKVKVYILE